MQPNIRIGRSTYMIWWVHHVKKKYFYNNGCKVLYATFTTIVNLYKTSPGKTRIKFTQSCVTSARYDGWLSNSDDLRSHSSFGHFFLVCLLFSSTQFSQDFPIKSDFFPIWKFVFNHVFDKTCTLGSGIWDMWRLYAVIRDTRFPRN